MMIEIFKALAPAAAPIIWVILALTAYSSLARYRKRRLLRCPETGGVATVDIEETLSAGPTGRRLRLRVKNCRLWPERGSCCRGCLIRCSQTWGSYGFDLATLRPFDMHDLKQHTSLPH